MRSKRRRIRLVAATAVMGLVGALASVVQAAPAGAAGGPNLALGKTATASSTNSPYGPGNVDDGNQGTYWESSGTSLPQWVQVDLGAAASVDQVVLKLPAGWEARTQTLSVQGSTNGTSFSTLAGSAGYSFNPASNNVVTIDFGAANVRYVRVNVTANTGWTAAQLSELEVHGTGTTPDGTNLAQGRSFTASSASGGLTAPGAGDGNQGTYWESANNAFPQWIQVDLGSTVAVNRAVLKLPPGWETRTQTLAVQGSPSGSGFSDIVPATGYSFNPATANTVTVNFTATTTRYLRLAVSANTGWPAGQLAELEVYGPGGPVDGTPPTAPGGLAYTETTPGQVKLTWTASTDAVGVTGYDVYANGTLRGSVAGNVLTYTDAQPTSATVAYQVKARDAAGNTSPASNTVTRQGDTTDRTPPTVPGNLAFTQPAAGQIKLTWSASTDAVGVTAYDVYANGSLRGSVAGNVLTYTDNQPAAATVSYFVRARDAAGNTSDPSATVTREGTVTGGSNLAVGKPITASGVTQNFVATNANDDSLTTYWEGGGGYPNTLAVNLRVQADLDRVVVKLNPDGAWGPRTQTIEVLGRNGTGAFTSLAAPAVRSFSPTSGGNAVTIPVSGRYSEVQLKITSNSGAGAGQVAEFQVIGAPAPTPDLTVTGTSFTPAAPIETDAVTLRATVQNAGTAASPASTVGFYLGGTKVGTAAVGALAAGASATVTLAVPARNAGTYPVTARVDETDQIIELNELNNAFDGAPLVVTEAPGPDLQVLGITANPSNPAVGAAVSFAVTVKNRGISATGATSVTRVTVGGTTLNGATPAIAAGATVTVPISGTWTATSGGATITATADATGVLTETNESNNGFSQAIVVGRGAAVPWTSYEAEAGTYQGTLLTADPLRTFGHTNFATESSGRQSVRLNSTGQYVEFTSANATNSIVVRNSIPDAPSGGGIDATLSLYINGAFAQKLNLSSKHSWLYGNTDGPEALTNSPQADARRLFDEAHALLSQSYPAGTKFRLQRDASDTASFYIVDTVDLEQVAPPAAKPAECTSITSYGAIPDDGLDDTAAIQAAVTADQNGTISCVWIPAGQWRQEKKILTDDPLNRGQFNQVGISNVTIKGAGMWYSQLYTLTQPQDAVGGINHPHEGNFGFDIDDNTQISDIAIFGSGRIRGGDGNGEGGVGLNGRFGKNTKISNVWIEHANVGVWVGRDYDNIPALWGPADGLEFSGMRIRDTYADGINFSNGTRNSKVFNSSFRTTGDDALAVWANRYVKDPSVDIAHDNHFVNNTVQLPWRANGIAIYGGYGNTIENNLIYDTMNYPGIMLATDHDPLPFSGTTLIANNAIYRGGGVFWNEDQEFGAITLFASTVDIVGVTIRDTDIYDSTYDGIQFKTGGGSMPNVKITNVRIDKSNNGAGILAMSGARGNAVLTNVTITNSADGDIVTQPGSTFTTPRN